jgi:hypothetical protein
MGFLYKHKLDLLGVEFVMMEKLLNLIGLYTKHQIADFLLNESQRQAESFKDIYRNQYEKMITDCESSLNSLLKKNPFSGDNQYKLITPFFDSAHNFHWIIAIVPQSIKYSNFGRIEVRDLSNSYDHEGFLDYCFYKNIDNSHPSKIELVDFRIGPKNKGIGSYLLTLLDNIAQSLGAAYIYGCLAPVDYENRPSQVRFYARNRYTISSNPQYKTEVSIIKWPH